MGLTIERMRGWWLEEYLPPRCRKARLRVDGGAVEARVRSYRAEEAPVAFVVHDGLRDPVEVRFAEGACFRRRNWAGRGGEGWVQSLKRCVVGLDERDLSGYAAGDVMAEGYVDSRCPTSREDLEERIAEWTRGVALIDGALWEECGEPVWEVSRIGGRPFLSPEFVQRGDVAYNALQKADAEAVAGAEPYGDIEVLIPEAVRSDPMREGLQAAVDRAGEEALSAYREYRNARDRARAALSDLAAYLDETSDAPWRAGE